MASTPEGPLAYLGPPGTFGEEAARRHAPRATDADLLPLPSHAEVARAVDAGEAAAGVLAIENSLNGSVAETLDILIHETSLPIQAELLVPVIHHLVAAPGVEAAAIEAVYSHPHALGQCRAFLRERHPRARLEAALSTAHAAELAMERAAGGEGAAAIATARAAERCGARVLAEGIQDRRDNATRFVVVGAEAPAPTGRDRTSIAFRFADDRAGLLAAALAEFASRGINCTKMESRPTRASMGEYVFLIDFEGHARDPRCAEALAALEAMTARLKVFGSYPRAEGARP